MSHQQNAGQTHSVKNPLKMWRCLNVGGNNTNKLKLQTQRIKMLNSRTTCSRFIQNVLFYMGMKHGVSHSG
jgi:hypothetical protein